MNRTTNALLIGLLLAGCGQVAPQVSQPATQAPRDPDAIRIGYVGPLTGDTASIGQDEKRALEMAIADFGNLGSTNVTGASSTPTSLPSTPIRSSVPSTAVSSAPSTSPSTTPSSAPRTGSSTEFSVDDVDIVYEDAVCNGQNAVNAINKLINSDGVKVILGGYCSGETLAMAPIAERNDVLLFTSGSSNPTIKDSGDFVFRNWPSDAIAAEQTMEDIAKNYTSVAIISENTDFAQGFLKAAMDSAGTLKVVVNETFNPNTTDFKTILGKVKTSGARALIVNAQTPTGDGLLVRQAREQGLNLPIYASNAVNGTEFFEQGKNAAEGVVFYDVALDECDPLVKEWMEEAKDAGINNFAYAATKYDSTTLVLRAISEVGYDAAKIRDWLYQLPAFRGIAGTYRFDQNGEATLPLVKKIAKDGEFVPEDAECGVSTLPTKAPAPRVTAVPRSTVPPSTVPRSTAPVSTAPVSTAPVSSTPVPASSTAVSFPPASSTAQ